MIFLLKLFCMNNLLKYSISIDPMNNPVISAKMEVIKTFLLKL